MTDHIQLVNRSFGQCCVSPGFFDDFYKGFLESSPEIREMFQDTDMAKQKQLLRTGLSHLILSYKGATLSSKKLDHLGESHSRGGLNIRPALYPLWIKSLMNAISHHDPNYSDDVEKAWQAVLNQGITAIKAKY